MADKPQGSPKSTVPEVSLDGSLNSRHECTIEVHNEQLGTPETPLKQQDLQETQMALGVLALSIALKFLLNVLTESVKGQIPYTVRDNKESGWA